ncbi:MULTISPECIES: hypothetical protein [unclassified Rhodanobacter]|uniref:hypothetical protein n=1 Tax=unclassified Rhodanobacter TaxID=2621553 RepID=UPI0007A9ADF0|nr:hypothetical protein [Rhodanobacter sp. FW510-R10]KZC32633.1 hypothetical protein RhoFW510R10_12015 [Rhodanobacter sp. FW510-R10]
MAASNPDLRRRAVFRSRVRQMLQAGYSVSRIAKETGKSLVHTTRIAQQELDEMGVETHAPTTQGSAGAQPDLMRSSTSGVGPQDGGRSTDMSTSP